MIRTNNLVKRFGRREALGGVSIDIPEGSVFALVGPNGAGKSTAIKICMNIHEPTSGAVEVLGVDSRASARMNSRRSATSPKTKSCPIGCASITSSATSSRSTRHGMTRTRRNSCDCTNCPLTGA